VGNGHRQQCRECGRQFHCKILFLTRFLHANRSPLRSKTLSSFTRLFPDARQGLRTGRGRRCSP
jgi:hypothetical protein